MAYSSTRYAIQTPLIEFVVMREEGGIAPPEKKKENEIKNTYFSALPASSGPLFPLLCRGLGKLHFPNHGGPLQRRKRRRPHRCRTRRGALHTRLGRPKDRYRQSQSPCILLSPQATRRQVYYPITVQAAVRALRWCNVLLEPTECWETDGRMRGRYGITTR